MQLATIWLVLQKPKDLVGYFFWITTIVRCVCMSAH